jgi:hypothetical protein
VPARALAVRVSAPCAGQRDAFPKIGRAGRASTEASKVKSWGVPKRALRGLLFAGGKLEAFKPHRGPMCFLADRMRSARSPPSLSLNRADLPRRTVSEVRLALACRSRSTRGRSTILRAGPPPLSGGAATLVLADFRSHRVQTASPKLSGLVHRRLPLGDGSSVSRVWRGWIDFDTGVGFAGFSRKIWGIETQSDFGHLPFGQSREV